MFTQLQNQTAIMVKLRKLKVRDNKYALKFFLCMRVLNVLLHIFNGWSPVANHCIVVFQIFFSTKGGFYSEGADGFVISSNRGILLFS